MRIGASERTLGTSPGATHTGGGRQNRHGDNTNFQDTLSAVVVGETTHRLGETVEEVVSGEGVLTGLSTTQLVNMTSSGNISFISHEQALEAYRKNGAEVPSTHTTPPHKTPESPQ